jgi:hypothetical protein
VDLQVLAERVYRERLWGTSKESWRPVQDRFTDFNPSPFIKNFLAHLVQRLVSDGYLLYGWTLEVRERARGLDEPPKPEASVARVYREGIYRKVVEVRDGVGVSEPRAERLPTPLKVSRLPGLARIEARELARVSDEAVKPEAFVEPTAVRAVYVRRVIKVPSLEYLRDLCTWKLG